MLNPREVCGSAGGRLIEIGTVSIKEHQYRFPPGGGILPEISSRKSRWEAGYDVYRTARLGGRNIGFALECIARIRENGDGDNGSLPAYATGALRDASDFEEFRDALNSSTGVEVVLLSGEDEARCLLDGYLALAGIDGGPARRGFLFDIGGGTTQYAKYDGERVLRVGCFPLGVIRLRAERDGALETPGGFRLAREVVFSRLVPVLPELEPDGLITGTGGTVKAVWKAGGKRPFGKVEIDRLMREAREGRFPAWMDAERRRIFLPGLLILSAIAGILQPREILYHPSGVARGLIARHLAPHRASETEKNKKVSVNSESFAASSSIVT